MILRSERSGYSGKVTGSTPVFISSDIVAQHPHYSFIILSTFLNDAVEQGYFVIHLVECPVAIPDAMGSNPIMCLVCLLLIHYIIGKMQKGAVGKRYFGPLV